MAGMPVLAALSACINPLASTAWSKALRLFYESSSTIPSADVEISLAIFGSAKPFLVFHPCIERHHHKIFQY